MRTRPMREMSGLKTVIASVAKQSSLLQQAGLLRRFAPRNDDRSAREGAAVLFLGGGDRFEVFVGTGHRRAGSEDVPLVLDLVDGERGDRVHLVHQLMIAS